MLVNFNALNHSPNAKMATFKGATEDIEQALLQLAELDNNDQLDLSSKNENKITILNGVAVPLKRYDGKIKGLDALVLQAAQHTPLEDKRHSAARYGAEVYRLANYGGGCSRKTMSAVDRILAERKTNSQFEKTRKGFQTSSTNVCGVPVTMDEALGIGRKKSYIRTNGNKELDK